MVASRNRSSVAIAPKPHLEEWTTREKLCLASLAIKHGNSWNSVARHMQAFIEKDRPDGWSNQKTCAAQFDKLMNELGVDKRPKRNEPSDTSSSVIYKKMAERRIKELEEKAREDRKSFLKICKDLEELDVDNKPAVQDVEMSLEKPTSQPQAAQLQTRQQQKNKKEAAAAAAAAAAANKSTTGATSKTNTSLNSGESDKPPTRALTRRESSRINLEKTLTVLFNEASEIKAINKLCRPTPDIEKSLGSYDKVILRHVDLSTIKQRFKGEVEDPYAVMNDLLLMFQNAIMYYPLDHPTYKQAIELRDKLVPQWERSLLDRSQRSKH